MAIFRQGKRVGPFDIRIGLPRGREYENNIQSEYLKKLNDTYLDYISKRTEFPVILIDVTNLDFKNNSKHFELVKNIIFQYAVFSSIR